MPTNQNRDEHAAVQRLRAFFTDMHAWEAEAKRQSKEEVRAGKLDPAEAFTRTVGVKSTHGTIVAGVHSGKQIETFRRANFALS